MPRKNTKIPDNVCLHSEPTLKWDLETISVWRSILKYLIAYKYTGRSAPAPSLKEIKWKGLHNHITFMDWEELPLVLPSFLCKLFQG